MGTLYRNLTGQSQKSHTSLHSETAGAAHPVITRTTTTNTLAGVVNHLTEPQAKKLEEFKELIHKEGWWSPDGLNGKPTHDNGTLLRYLRARKFDVQGAYGQFTDTEKWLKEQMVNELYEQFDVDHYERARQMYPQWTGHRDRRGIPIYVYVIKGLDSKAVSKYQKESQAYKDRLPKHKKLDTPAKLIPLFALYHNLLNLVLPLVSTLERPHPEVPVTNSTNIVDIQGVGLTQFWNLKAHMQDASVLATAHYPETLDRIFIIGAPTFFPTVWGWIKRWFDPVTVSKIFILGKHEVRPTLEKFMDPKDFPKRYGGQLDWDVGHPPHLDDETREALERDGNKGWVLGPSLWLNHQRVVVGSANGKLRRSHAEIEKLMPVVYAADGTEEPVHPGATTLKGPNGSVNKTKDTLSPGSVPHRTSSHAIAAARAASGAPPAATPAEAIEPAKPAPAPAAPAEVVEPAKPTEVVQQREPEVATPPPAAETSATNPKPATPVASKTESPPASSSPVPEIKQSNIRNAPIDGAPVHLPEQQPGFPEQTAEYIHPSRLEKMNGSADSHQIKPETQPESLSQAQAPPEAQSKPDPQVQPQPQAEQNTTINPPTEPTPLTNGTIHSHPPSQPYPGPQSQHEKEVAQTIAKELESESTSTIPASLGNTNGELPHPEIIVSTDKSKGLAIEAEKIDRPGSMERYITATETPVGFKT